MSLEPALQATVDRAMLVLQSMVSNLNVDFETALESLPGLSEDVRNLIRHQWNQSLGAPVDEAAVVLDHDQAHIEWLSTADRADWYYWPRLRSHLLERRRWPTTTVRSIDNATDKILGALENPVGEMRFVSKGLVVGYVQSGKTANYSALIAKAADAGYRLILVLSGVHNSLRLQTQRRLDAELVGKVNGRWGGVGRPRPNREWLTFTTAEQDGDFEPGNVSPAALTATRPSLMVIKKNYSVLSRLVSWLESAPEDVRDRIPCLIIDDEADQASINTGGNRQADVDEDVDDEISPTRINALVRGLIQKFSRVAYIAYTATPFANILIDHEAYDREVGFDLYPRSFIIALPRPEGYFGAERIFGTPEEPREGMDIIRIVPDQEIRSLVPPRRSETHSFVPQIPPSLYQALDDFILAGVARAHRGAASEPATMLIHTSYSTIVQQRLTRLVADEVERIRDDWRYTLSRRKNIKTRLRKRWEGDFRQVTRSENPLLDVPFEALEPYIGPFLEQLAIRQVNNVSEDDLDYEREPHLKVVVIGGNRLSRGLTLEGLLVSYFVRFANAYDTLMQMGRWFGYREGYADLTRIYTTETLRTWFRELALVEEELREEIAMFERGGLTPLDFGVRVRAHPAMLVTSPLKMKSVERLRISYAGQMIQTITFPFDDLEWLGANIEATRRFLSALGSPMPGALTHRPQWLDVPAHAVLGFLDEYQFAPQATRARHDQLTRYIREQGKNGELTRWVVGVMGRVANDVVLGSIDLGIHGHPAINLIERTKLRSDPSSLKAIVSPADERLGLTDDQMKQAQELRKQPGAKLSDSRALRSVREPDQGLLLIYPISRASGHLSTSSITDERMAIYPDPDKGEHIIGIAIVFPDSESDATVEYVRGTVGE